MKTWIIKNMHPQNSTLLIFVCLILTVKWNHPEIKQATYDNFEGARLIKYTAANYSQLDTLAANPDPNSNNNSAKCAKYIRSHRRYDCIKMDLNGKLYNVGNYTVNQERVAKIKLKTYTNAPIGSEVAFQLCKLGNKYPRDVYGLFEARTTVKGMWEELVFNFVMFPLGSETTSEQIVQMNLLFEPNSNSTSTWYFDELTGPPIEQIINKGKSRKK
jgi:hypothetical protein